MFLFLFFIFRAENGLENEKKKEKEKKRRLAEKKTNYVATSSIKTMDFTTKNRIKHMLQRYNIENSATNFNKLAEVIHKRILLFIKSFLIWYRYAL